MEALLIYLLKASALLGIFFLSYLLLLKKETSFELNRKFLAGGLFASAILPAIYFTRTIFVEASNTAINFMPATVNSAEIAAENTFDWWTLTGYLYLAITGFFILRFLIQLTSVFRIIIFNRKEYHNGFKIIKTNDDHLPYSFFKYIVYNPANHSQNDLRLILEHEKVHAKQMHSLDILLASLIQSLLWFNPFAWFYKKTIEQNLEFIADRETVSNKAEIKEYQRALVKVSIADLRPALTNHFYQSFIKKRILMLNQKSSTHSPAWKLSLVMPLLLAFMLLFNVKTEAQVINENNNTIQQTSKPTVVNVKTEVTISSETTREDLDEIQEFLKDYNVTSNFSNLNFNDGKLTSIRMDYEDLKSGNKGNVVKNNKNGIEPFIFFTNDAGEIGTKDIQTTGKKTYTIRSSGNSSSKNLSKLGKDPLYIINGKTFKASRLKGKYIGLKSDLKMIPADEALTLYGNDAKAGAVIVPEGEIIRDFNKEMKKIQSGEGSFSGKYIAIGSEGKPSLMSINQGQSQKQLAVFYTNDDNQAMTIVGRSGNFNTTNSNDNIVWKVKSDTLKFNKSNAYSWRTESDSTKPGENIIYFKDKTVTGKPNYQFKSSDSSTFIKIKTAGDYPAINSEDSNIKIYGQTARPLYVIDGNVKGENFDTNSIDPENIAAIMVLKDEKATKKYGENGKNGVIEIHTKSSGYVNKSKKTDAIVFRLTKTQTDTDLEQLKKKILESTGMKVTFSGIKRNTNNEITSIKISGEKEGSNASAIWDVKEGISPIIIGLDRNGGLLIKTE